MSFFLSNSKHFEILSYEGSLLPMKSHNVQNTGPTYDDQTSILRGSTCNTDATRRFDILSLFLIILFMILPAHAHTEGGYAPRQVMILSVEILLCGV